MAESATSTAYGPMVLVAIEQSLPLEQRIINDHFAYKMLPAYMKIMVKLCSLKPIRQVFFNLMDKGMPGLRNSFASRKRYINDKVLEALTTETQSLVILGAGLDTLAYRLPQLANIRIFEVDLAENIAYKTQQLNAIFGTIPANISLVPIDFESQNLETTLAKYGYSFEQNTIFVWEAVSQYLSESAVRATFQVLANAKAGSRLLFTYVLKDFIDGKNTYGLDSLYQRFRVKEQHWFFGLDPQKLGEFLGEYDWRIIEDCDGNDFFRRYMRTVGRTETISELEHTVYAEKL